MRHENLADLNSAGGAVEVVRQFVRVVEFLNFNLSILSLQYFSALKQHAPSSPCSPQTSPLPRPACPYIRDA